MTGEPGNDVEARLSFVVRILHGIAIAGALVLFSGCNHLFYHPDAVVYSTPQRYGHLFDDITLTEGGPALHLWRIRAHGRPRGIVVHFHGNAQNMSAHMRFVEWLAEGGYDVVTFDYRGYGSSRGKPDREGTVEDGARVLRWVAGLTDPSKADLFVVGQSLGGAIAVAAIARARVDRIRAVVIESAFASYRGMARSKLAQFFLTWPLQWPLSWLVSDELSPVDEVGQLSMPILFIHGDSDPVVPCFQGRALYEAATAPGKEFWELEGAGHTPAFLDPRLPGRGDLLRWLASHEDKSRR